MSTVQSEGKRSGFDGKVRPKECILARCQHIFCRECIDERINVRSGGKGEA